MQTDMLPGSHRTPGWMNGSPFQSETAGEGSCALTTTELAKHTSDCAVYIYMQTGQHEQQRTCGRAAAVVEHCSATGPCSRAENNGGKAAVQGNEGEPEPAHGQPPVPPRAHQGGVGGGRPWPGEGGSQHFPSVQRSCSTGGPTPPHLFVASRKHTSLDPPICVEVVSRAMTSGFAFKCIAVVGGTCANLHASAHGEGGG